MRILPVLLLCASCAPFPPAPAPAPASLVARAFEAQRIAPAAPRADAPTGMDGKSARAALERYERGQAAPAGAPSLQGAAK